MKDHQESNILNSSAQPEDSEKQPTPTELSRMAIALAQTHRTPITEKNRDELLHNAYGLWEAADKLIKGRKANAARAAAGRVKEQRTHAVNLIWGKRDHVTFREIADQSLLPKRVGKKGEGYSEPQFITTPEGVKKAFLAFRNSVSKEELALRESESFQFIDFVFKGEPAAEVLQGRAMSKRLFAKFLAWQKERCGLEKLSTE